MKNPIDSLIEVFAPQAALRRRAARNILSLYEAGIPSTLRKFRRDTGAANNDVRRGAVPLRVQARHLEQNHDIARGALRTLVNNIVGPAGIGIEPQPRRADGSIHDDYAAALREAWRDWCKTPEVTHRLTWNKVQRLAVKTWLRDGECFSQLLSGKIDYLDHGTRVPFSLELLEPDFVPMHHGDTGNIRQGIELNAWGRPVAYYCHKQHPGEWVAGQSVADLKRISADNMLHIACLDRFHQLRGVSEFASVITRLEDIKDYEESERIAAKIAAMLTGYVKRGTPDMYQPELDENGQPAPRQIDLRPGMIFDNLAIGEEVGLIDSKRPNPNVVTFRQGQLRAVAAGIGGSYSSISRDYNGTYSAQRQELVEQWIHYATLADEFTGMFVQPIWERFVETANLSGVVRKPSDVVTNTADDALFIAQSMPWIDPLKEANAWHQLVLDGFASEVEVMRKRGVNPRDVLEQIAAWRQKAEEKGLRFTSQAGVDAAAAAPEPNIDQQDTATVVAARASADAIVRAAEIAASAGRVQQPINVSVEAPVVNVSQPEVRVENIVPQAAPVIENRFDINNEIKPTPVDVHVSAPAVSVTNAVQPAEIREISIVAMPTRETSTTVTRDEEGSIVTTTQTEQDA